MNFLEAQSPLIKVLKKRIKFFPYRLESHGASPDNSAVGHCIAVLLILLLVYSYMTTLFMLEVGTYLNDDNPVTSMAILLEGSSNVLFIFIFIWTTIFTRMDQINLINSMLGIEKDISRMQFSRLKYSNKLKLITKIELTFNASYCSLFALITTITITDKFTLYFAQVLVSVLEFYFVLLVMQFIKNFIRIFENLFEEINRNLGGYILLKGHAFQSRNFRKIFKLHHQLVLLIEIFNKSFGTVFFGIFILAFSMITFETYFVISNIIFAIDRLDYSTIFTFSLNLTCLNAFFYYIWKIGNAAAAARRAVRDL